MALEYDFFRLVPVSVFHRALQIGAMVPVQVLEDPVLVLQATMNLLWRITNGSERPSLGLRRGGGGRKA